MDSCGGDKGPKSRLNTDHWKKWILNGMAEGIYFILKLLKFRFLKVVLTVGNENHITNLIMKYCFTSIYKLQI